MQTPTQREKIQDAIETALKAGTSQNVLAKKIGISASIVINIRRNEWETISDRMENKIAAYFKIQMEDQWPLHNTWNLKAISRVCDEARTRSRFLGIAAYTGAGKTKALMHYAHTTPNTYYVLCTVIMSRKSFLFAVMRAMGLNESGSITHVTNRIISRLNGVDKPLLIIDDAGKLSHGIYRVIQLLYDQTEHRAGMVIAGTEFLKEEIDKQASYNRMGFRELQRRVAYWQPLQRPSGKIVTEICAHHGITDENAVSYIMEHCQDYGTLSNMVINAKHAAEVQGKPIDRPLLADLAMGDHVYRQFQAAKR